MKFPAVLFEENANDDVTVAPASFPVCWTRLIEASAVTGKQSRKRRNALKSFTLYLDSIDPANVFKRLLKSKERLCQANVRQTVQKETVFSGSCVPSLREGMQMAFRIYSVSSSECV